MVASALLEPSTFDTMMVLILNTLPDDALLATRLVVVVVVTVVVLSWAVAQ